jgi:hypothetical protein
MGFSMRINELLNEADDGGNNAGQGSATKRPSKSSNVHDQYHSAIQGMETYTDPNSYYTMYRFGVDMASGPKEHYPYDPAGPIGNQMATLAYTDVEQKIIDNSKKNLGLKSKKLTSKDSTEHTDTHVSSPVAKVKRNKYGI